MPPKGDLETLNPTAYHTYRIENRKKLQSISDTTSKSCKSRTQDILVITEDDIKIATEHSRQYEISRTKSAHTHNLRPLLTISTWLWGRSGINTRSSTAKTSMICSKVRTEGFVQSTLDPWDSCKFHRFGITRDTQSPTLCALAESRGVCCARKSQICNLPGCTLFDPVLGTLHKLVE